MDIYLTDLETGDRLRLPMLPEKINVQAGTLFQGYTILSVGEIKIPAGEELTALSWQGILPGENRKYEPYIREWSDPNRMQSQWSIFRAKKKILRLLVTETPINHNVYLERYTVEYSGGYGDYNYSINFTQAKDLKVSTVLPDVQAARTGPETARPEQPPATTYTVVKGDTLWSIAQRYLGSGSRYSEIHDANRDVIGSNPNSLKPGQVLTISGAVSGAPPKHAAPKKRISRKRYSGGGGHRVLTTQ